jgi:hypothetical protein
LVGSTRYFTAKQNVGRVKSSLHCAFLGQT